MQTLKFKENESLTLGAEIEVQLINPVDGDLKSIAPAILESIEEVGSYPRIKPEIFQSMIEIDTPICTDVFQMGNSLRESLAVLRLSASQHDAKLIMAGTHPFAQYSQRLLSDANDGRYFNLIDRNRWIARRLQIFGLHVHLGMRNGDHAIAMNNALCHYLPVILALSASSPFFQSEDTGLASSRITFFEAIPTGGHPYLLNSWQDFQELIGRLVRSQSITSIKDLWWDIRPNVEYGTIEIRIADCPPTIKETESIIALVHALTHFIDSEIQSGRRFAPPPEWVLRENKWRASRYGLEAELIHDSQGTTFSFPNLWAQLRKSLDPVVQSFGYQDYFKFLDQIVDRGASYYRQRQNFNGDYKSVIDHLIRENEADQPEWK